MEFDSLDALRDLEHMGCKVHWFRDGDFETPEVFDLSHFLETERENALKAITFLANFVRSPAIEDWFEDHLERREWRFEINPTLSKAYEGNRLRGNNISVVRGCLELLKYSINPESKQRDRLGEIFEQIPQKSSKEETTVGFADQIAELALNALQLFADNSDQKVALG
jgi:hypothetical protein